MANENHLALSNFIKKVHEDLRQKSRILGPDISWQQHCSNANNLKLYATSMKELAINYWEKKDKNQESKAASRINWTIDLCKNYFTFKIVQIRKKELEIAKKINLCTEEFDFHNFTTKWKLLDVGSCYNPFGKVELFEVTPIDIAPATKQVYKCDFLNVKTNSNLIIEKNEILELAINSFDVIVFSLLLEYLPCYKQRRLCCEKAYNLLRSEGLLIIITPDSNHVGSNAKLMKSWQFILAKMGLSRIKYEKLPHLHCMAFRKSPSKLIPHRWTKLQKNDQLYQEIYIPQDFKDTLVTESNDGAVQDSSDVTRTLFHELPVDY